MSDFGFEAILRHHSELIARWKHAISLMKAGKMGTNGTRDGRVVDTTQETISDFETYIAGLEAIDAGINKRGI
jgi:hypothetical protein